MTAVLLELRLRVRIVTLGVALGSLLLCPRSAVGQSDFDRSRDRGPGVPLSQFGTYIEPRELIVYPFYEYYRDSDAEYSPAELGFDLDEDYRGRFRAREGLLFIAYGVSSRLAVELEAAVISATLDKSPADPSSMPPRIEESGLGDVEGQIRWRWREETARRPEVFSYFETVFPLQKKKLLIGTRFWEFKLGTGIVRGFRWGTTTVRAAIAYEGEDRKAAVGEYAVEYLRRISRALRVFAALEGSEDEVEFITEAQWTLRPGVVLKLNNAFGVTSKATDWAPEIGVMFSIRR